MGLTQEQLDKLITDGARAVVTEHADAAVAALPTGDDAPLTRADLGDINTRLADVQAQQDAMRVGMVAGSADDSHRGEKFSMQKAMYSVAMQASGATMEQVRAAAPLEWEMSDAAVDEYRSANQMIVNRAQATSPDSLGGFLVPGEVRDEFFVEALRPKIILFDLGMQSLTATSTPVDIPIEGDVPTVAAVSENQLTTAADVTFDSLRAEPHTMQAFIKTSNQFLTMASAEGYLRNVMARELAIQANAWGLTGTGVGGEPLGVKNRITQTVTMTDDNTSALYDELLKYEELVADADALDGNLGWAASNRAVRAIRGMTSGATTGEWTNGANPIAHSVVSGAMPGILGYPYKQSTALASGTASDDLIFGDWSRLLMVTWGPLVIEASRVANDALQRRQTHIVAHQDVDFIVTKANAFAMATGWDTVTMT